MAHINCGGQTETLRGKISQLNFQPSTNDSAGLELWIKDEDGNESLTYLSADEAMILISEIKQAVIQRMNM